MLLVVLYGVIVSSVLCLVCAQTDECGTSVGALVTRGRPIAHGEYPWLAALYRRDESGDFIQFCGGALLTPTVVLTAAHCLVFEEEVLKAIDIRVGLGKLYRDFYRNEDEAVIAYVGDVIVPEHFLGSLSSFALDVGLLKLSMRIEMSDYVLPVCIDLHMMTSVGTGAPVHAAGWGTSENGTSTDRALAADLSYLDYHECLKQVRLSYRKYVTHDKICSLSINGSQVDRGDSGGPLTYLKNGRHFVVGIVSTKIRDQTSFSIFTALSNREIHHWVREQIEKLKLSGKEEVIAYDTGIEVSVAGIPGINIPLRDGSVPIGRVFDCVTKKVYYWSQKDDVIYESIRNPYRSYNFTTEDSFLGQTVDWIDRKLYFVCLIDFKVALKSVSLYTGRLETILLQGKYIYPEKPKYPAVHPTLRKIYILNDDTRVEYVDLDSSPSTLKSFHNEEAHSYIKNMAIDWQTNELCWLTGGPGRPGSIKCKNLEMEAIRTIFDGVSGPDYGSLFIGFAITPSTYQWADKKTVYTMSKSSSVVTNNTYGHKVGELVYFPETCPTLTPGPKYFKG